MNTRRFLTFLLSKEIKLVRCFQTQVGVCVGGFIWGSDLQGELVFQCFGNSKNHFPKTLFRFTDL